MAFETQVVLVQGPPGTGKTQTILNVIANAILLNQTVAVVSNNNTAIKNIADKLEKNGLGFLLASLGRRANKEKFIEQQSPYPDWIFNCQEALENKNRLKIKLNQYISTLNRLINVNNDRAILVQKILQLQAEYSMHKKFENIEPSLEARAASEKYLASDLLKLLVECENGIDKYKMAWLLFIKEVFLFGLRGRTRRQKLIAEGSMVLRSLYYEQVLIELQNELLSINTFLDENEFVTIQKKVQEYSWSLLRQTLKERYCKKNVRQIITNRDYWNEYELFLNEYPVVLSTTHAIKTSLSPECLYDIVIVDESSQVDLPTGVLALSCARRAFIVGDEKQLPNVMTDNNEKRALEIWNKFELRNESWNYATNNLLTSAKQLWPKADTVMLKEHYRCHPKIAGFINKKFYEDQLIIMTEDNGEEDVLQVVFTAKGNHARGLVNQRQAEVIEYEIYPELIRNGFVDIGVITPYREQVNLLNKIFGEKLEVDTVNGFQGREKQAIILSTVLNKIKKINLLIMQIGLMWRSQELSEALR